MLARSIALMNWFLLPSIRWDSIISEGVLNFLKILSSGKAGSEAAPSNWGEIRFPEITWGDSSDGIRRSFRAVRIYLINRFADFFRKHNPTRKFKQPRLRVFPIILTLTTGCEFTQPKGPVTALTELSTRRRKSDSKFQMKWSIKEGNKCVDASRGIAWMSDGWRGTVKGRKEGSTDVANE